MNFIKKLGLARIKSNTAHVTEVRNWKGYGVDKAIRYGSAWGFGYVKGFYREKAMVRGVPVDAIAGVGSTILGLLVGGKTGAYLNSLGDSGISSWLGSLGAAYGAKKSGRRVYVLDAGARPPANLPPGLTAVAGLPQAVGGVFLTPEEIAQFSAQR